jgi:hypothetical protein
VILSSEASDDTTVPRPGPDIGIGTLTGIGLDAAGVGAAENWSDAGRAEGWAGRLDSGATGDATAGAAWRPGVGTPTLPVPSKTARVPAASSATAGTAVRSKIFLIWD